MKGHAKGLTIFPVVQHLLQAGAPAGDPERAACVMDVGGLKFAAGRSVLVDACGTQRLIKVERGPAFINSDRDQAVVAPRLCLTVVRKEDLCYACCNVTPDRAALASRCCKPA